MSIKSYQLWKIFLITAIIFLGVLIYDMIPKTMASTLDIEKPVLEVKLSISSGFGDNLNTTITEETSIAAFNEAINHSKLSPAKAYTIFPDNATCMGPITEETPVFHGALLCGEDKNAPPTMISFSYHDGKIYRDGREYKLSSKDPLIYLFDGFYEEALLS